MSAERSSNAARETTYTYAPEDLPGGPGARTVYEFDAHGRLVARQSEPAPSAPDNDPPDEPIVREE